MDRQVKSQGIKAAEIQARWGIPDWTRAEEYPDAKAKQITERMWRWEFLRRQPSYRRRFEIAERWDAADAPVTGNSFGWQEAV